MKVFQKNLNTKSEKDTGFGTNASNYGGRFIDKDGNANVKKSGVRFMENISWFHIMLRVSNYKFLTIVISFYFIINCFFATIYYLVGTDKLRGIVGGSEFDKFAQAFFFSIQTFTTVGYGHISPIGFITGSIAAIEALTGLLSFAIATGLFYARFSKPKAFLKFSSKIVIAPYQSETALMLRLSPYKNTNLSDAEAKLTLAIRVKENDVQTNKFYPLKLEMSRINTLSLNWTLVHLINDQSPLFGISKADFDKNEGEIMVFIKAFDDMFSANVVKSYSYTFKELVYGAKFKPMYFRNTNDTKTILYLNKISDFEHVEME